MGAANCGPFSFASIFALSQSACGLFPEGCGAVCRQSIIPNRVLSFQQSSEIFIEFPVSGQSGQGTSPPVLKAYFDPVIHPVFTSLKKLLKSSFGGVKILRNKV